MNNELYDRLDKVGWMPKNDDRYDYAVFHWMQEASARIEQLTVQVETLSKELKRQGDPHRRGV